MFATWGNNHGQDNFSLYIQGDYIIVEEIKKERKNKKHILKIMRSGGTYYEKNNSKKRNCNR